MIPTMQEVCSGSYSDMEVRIASRGRRPNKKCVASQIKLTAASKELMENGFFDIMKWASCFFLHYLLTDANYAQ